MIGILILLEVVMKKSLKSIALVGVVTAMATTFSSHANAFSENSSMENQREPKLVFPVIVIYILVAVREV